jgi:hypothetical protein
MTKPEDTKTKDAKAKEPLPILPVGLPGDPGSMFGRFSTSARPEPTGLVGSGEPVDLTQEK